MDSPTPHPSDEARLRAENAELRARLEEAEKTLRAIRAGGAASLVVEAADGASHHPVRRADEEVVGAHGDVMHIPERKRGAAEEALRESEARYRSLFENMQEGFAFCQMLFDEKGQPEDFVYITVNEALVRLTGLGDVTGKRVTQLFPGIKELNPELFVTYGRVASTGNPERFEIDFKPLGLRLAVSAYCPMKGYFAAVFDDITRRARTEEVLRESEQRFRIMADGLPLIVWVHDARGRLQFVNQTYGDFFGVTPRQIAGLNWQPLVHADDGEAYANEFSACVRDRRHFQAEVRVRRFDGEWRWLESRAQPRFSVSGEFLGMVGSSLDITERKQADLELVNREAHLRRVINNQLGLVGVIDRDGILIEVDQRSLAIAKARREQVIGRHFAEAPWWNYDPGVARQMRDAMRRAMAGEVVRFDVSLFAHGDEGVMIDFMIAPVFGADGEVEYLVPSGVDIRERHAAEQSLRASEERFRALTTASSDVVYRMSADWSEMHPLDGRGVFASTEAGSRTWLQDYNHPEDQPKILARVHESIRTKSIFELEHRVRRVNGTWGWTFSRAVPMLDATGKIAEWFGTASDVTARKEAEAALRQSEERFRAAVGAVSDIIWTNSAEGKMEGEQATWGAFTGQRQEDYQGHGWSKAVHPDDAQPTLDAWNLAVAEKRAFELEHRVRRSDGEWRLCAIRAVPVMDPGGEIREWVGVHSDVTERRRSETNLRASEKRMRLATEATAVGIWEWNVLTDALHWDAQMFRLYGVAPTADGIVPYSDWSGAVMPEELAENERILQDTLRAGGQSRREFRIRRRDDGEVRNIEAVETVRRNERGGIEWVVGTNLDVTERKQAEQAIRTMNAQLETRVAERTAKLEEMVGELEHFSYTITHDMRAPLRGIQGFGELMEEALADGRKEDVQEFLRRIRTAAARMDLLIRDALNYSRTVRQELPLTPVDVGALLRGMLDSYPEFQWARARIEIEGEIPLVMGNEAGLTQCFSNLLGNAVKFVKPGQKPEIRIRAERRESAETRPRAAAASPLDPAPLARRRGAAAGVRIWVEDKGIGIPGRFLPRVFDMFSRGHNTHEGTGIGLALVRKAVERMGGKAGVESDERGSRFWIELGLGDRGEGR